MKRKLRDWFEKYRSNVITPVAVTIVTPLSFAAVGFIVFMIGFFLLLMFSLLSGNFDYLEKIVGSFWSVARSWSLGGVFCSIFFIIIFFRLYFSKA